MSTTTVDCAHLHGSFGPGCPYCTSPQPVSPAAVEALRNAWMTAPRYDEQSAWAALYEALYPITEAKPVYYCPRCGRGSSGGPCGCGGSR